jgi:hypothetical protein
MAPKMWIIISQKLPNWENFFADCLILILVDIWLDNPDNGLQLPDTKGYTQTPTT